MNARPPRNLNDPRCTTFLEDFEPQWSMGHRPTYERILDIRAANQMDPEVVSAPRMAVGAFWEEEPV